MIKVKKVEFYSGGKGAQVPKRIFTDSGIIRVHTIIETSLEEDYHTKERKMTFTFKSFEDGLYILESSKKGYQLTQL